MALHRVRRWFQQTGITQHELACQTEVLKQSQISQFVCGTSGVSRERALLLVKATDDIGRWVHPPPIKLTVDDFTVNKPPSRRKPPKKSRKPKS